MCRYWEKRDVVNPPSYLNYYVPTVYPDQSTLHPRPLIPHHHQQDPLSQLPSLDDYLVWPLHGE
jgi:hypothetical protein